MKRNCPRWVLAVGLVMLSWTGRCQAVEEWADRNLKVTNGLELWLDASRLPAAALAQGRSAVKHGEPIDLWLDASGRRRHALANVLHGRPIYQADLVKDQPGQAVLRFDGADDCLTIGGLGQEWQDVTIILVAAPYANAGGFRAPFALKETGKNDYNTGLNIDQGNAGSGRFERINVEGRGFTGEANLLKGSYDFATFHVMTVTSTPGKEGTRLFVDGKTHDSRPRSAGTLRADEIHIGARAYSNTPAPPSATGFFDGAIAEVLVYRRVLTDPERASVEQHLRTKYAGLFQLKGLGPRQLVHMLVPGFTVRELPVEISNLTGVHYAPDGRLFALGYDGRIHVLRDTDGDGLEDRVEPFWDQPTLRTPTAMAWRPEGLYVVSNSKVSLLRDTDGDGKADKEDIVTTNWAKDDGHTGGGVDALGLAFDDKGNLYFGLGCADYSNAYRIKDGKSHYDIKSERGTILRASADRKTRDIVCTGIRFPYSLAFNRHGDLFCSDQEGETWLPNGNPLDELNHIVAGRHYGFPYRHEQHLPNVIDEPPVVGFGPQHQSTCGLLFNEKRPDRKSFGPDFWEGDALVCGFSRGKLWRTTLVKTPAGYVGRPTLIAAFGMMMLDCTISPAGDLVVNCHSGPPDWGTGPRGPGRLFKISYTDRTAPQPVVAWAAGPLEVRVAFDRPVDPGFLDATKAQITFGEHVRAADRFEVHKPPYALVQNQMKAFRGQLGVAAARWSEDRRTLILTTDPHPVKATYALKVPIRSSTSKDDAIDVAYDLNGVEATWTPDSKESDKGKTPPTETGWLPYTDWQIAHELTKMSAEHDKLLGLLQEPGTLRLRTSKGSQPQTVSIKTPSESNARYLTTSDPSKRPLPLASFSLPWTPPPPPAMATANVPPPELAGGDWKRGEALYFSKEANCVACHLLRGKGAKIGPDLSNLIHRDAGSVFRDISDPSAVINPDYVSHVVALKNGKLLTGLVRAEGDDRLRVIDNEAKETVVARSEIEELQASATSVMPKGFAEQLKPGQMKDLLTFLLNTSPPQEKPKPPLRTRAEVEAVLKAGDSGKLPAQPRPLHIVLVAGPKDHGPGEHDYPAWQKQWKDLLAKAPGVRVSTAFGWPELDQWKAADLVIFYYWNHDWNEQCYKDLDAFLARRGGAIFLHSAVIEDKEPEKLAARIGIAFHPKRSKYRHGALDLTMTKEHPITRGLNKASFVDESYWPLIGETSRIETLATTVEEGQPRPMLWTYQPGKGRVVGCILGHYAWTFDDPFYRLLILRSMAWVLQEPPGRFHPLVMEGVKLRAEP